MCLANTNMLFLTIYPLFTLIASARIGKSSNKSRKKFLNPTK